MPPSSGPLRLFEQRQGLYGIDGKPATREWLTAILRRTNSGSEPSACRTSARPLRPRAFSRQERHLEPSLLSRDRRQPGARAIAGGRDPHPTDFGHRHRQDLDRLPDRLEAVQSRWNLGDWRQAGEPSRRPRILFLADRNTLADQAYNDFTSFAGITGLGLARITPGEDRQKGQGAANASVFFTIFQTFMSGPPKDGQPSPYFGEYPPDFFSTSS